MSQTLRKKSLLGKLRRKLIVDVVVLVATGDEEVLDPLTFPS